MESPEEARRRAEQAFQVSPFTQNATEQSIPNADARNAYNAELNQQRSNNGSGNR